MYTKKEVNYAAVIESKGARLKIVARPIPHPGPRQVVVRNHAIAANPADWKQQDWGFMIFTYPTVVGSDACGIISQIGSSVTKVKVGDRVTGFGTIIGSDNEDEGAWQTYTLLNEIAVAKIPDFMSFEEGASFPMAITTAAMGLYSSLGIQIPETGAAESRGEGILIWGAGSAVGTAAIQLAKLSGFIVFATASPKHHGYLKSLGASRLFDYRDLDVVSKIASAARAVGTPISLALDSVAEGDSPKLTIDTLLASGGKGSKAVGTLDWPEGSPKPEGVTWVRTSAGHAFSNRADLGEWLFNEFLPKVLESKAIVPAPPVEIVEGGIDAAQTVFNKLKAGVSGKKLVVRID